MITSLTNRIQYSTDGVGFTFPYPFKILKDADLQVYLSTGATDVLQLLTTNYTVTGAGVDTGGSVLFNTPPGASKIVTIRRKLPETQESDYIPNSDLPAATIETDFDKMVMLIQQLQDQLDRCVRYNDTDTNINQPILPYYLNRAGRVMGFNGEGDLTLFPYDPNNLNLTVVAVLSDHSVTTAKLALTLDFSGISITGWPNTSIPASAITDTFDLRSYGKALTLQDNSIYFAWLRQLGKDKLRPSIEVTRLGVNLNKVGIRVTGAGTAAANGDYDYSASTSPTNGFNRYVQASNGYYIQMSAGGKWGLYTNTDTKLYEVVTTASTATQPTTPDQSDQTWAVSGGSNPAPTFNIAAYDADINGTCRATYFKGDGSQLTNVPTSNGLTTVLKLATPKDPWGALVVVDSDGYPRACGSGTNGQTGLKLGATEILSTVICKDSSGVIEKKTIAEVVCAGANSYIRTTDGYIYTTGIAASGALGNGLTTPDVALFKRLTLSGINLFDATNPENGGSAVLNRGFAIAAAGGGSTPSVIYTWGKNDVGQCAIGGGSDQLSPATPTIPFSPNTKTIRQVLARGRSAWVLTDTGELFATGYNAVGELGVNDLINKSAFTACTGVPATGVFQVFACGSIGAAGASYISTFALYNGILYATGYNAKGTLGFGAGANRQTFGAVAALGGTNSIQQFFCGGAYFGSCLAYSNNGGFKVYLFGYNGGGQLGTGNQTDQLAPVVNSVLTARAALQSNQTAPILKVLFTSTFRGSGNLGTIFVLFADGTLFGAGDNTNGQLGLGHVTTPQTTFQQLPVPPNLVDISYVAANGASTGSNVLIMLDNKGRIFTMGQADGYENGLGLGGSNLLLTSATPIKL